MEGGSRQMMAMMANSTGAVCSDRVLVWMCLTGRLFLMKPEQNLSAA